MNRYLGILITFLLTFAVVQPVNAHVLKTDGSIGAVLHIGPEDDPVAGEESNFYFEFKDRENKFQPKQCNCTVRVLQSGKEILSQNLFENNATPSLTNASFSFTFPQKDIYTIQIEGKPNKPNAFQPFTLAYDIRVAKKYNGNTTKNTDTQIVYYVMGCVLVFFVTLFLVKKLQKGGEKK